ncbi:glycerate dehydrogenase/D-3-phosphoglycerate dehydrogenase [Paenibacillus methanolicus]|uniref:Glycerate dehydrogenase/D-3-phosphoglycerate dehydrogenase n=2 Tax=Paenibacillus methanolicus TaxID=582686 RepID=A0A5S5C1S8_9BACL|nr:D-isomer specific 2-hydroxyacid dehydrogenase family protein [Paenibacillus methanolicus]TYP73257.1 glycerate dehydrogenase/D-3-phosphoglycerate dehydrogenase [Paenibacillus methanolicus]
MNSKWSCAVDQAIGLSDEEAASLTRACQVEYVDLGSSDKEQFSRFDMLLLHTKLPDEVLDAFSRCQYIGIRAHNTDYVNGSRAQTRGIVIRGLPQFGEHAVAEHAFALIFALTKQLIPAHNNTRTGSWRDGLSPGMAIRGKTLGIIGYGTIGKEVATLARALGMQVRIVSRHPSSAIESLDEVLRQSDIITLHASTKHNNGPLITKDEINCMKDGVILINTARGSLIEYDDLIQALLAGKIAGAGLDVFPEEPYRNPELLDLPNVVCTPHIAFFTTETIHNMNRCLVEQAVRYVEAHSDQEDQA